MYLVLGYGAKIAKVQNWDKQRRKAFLIDENCDFPKSIDDSVWGTIFDSEEQYEYANIFFQNYHTNLLELIKRVDLNYQNNNAIVSVALELESCSADDLNAWNIRLFGNRKNNFLENNITAICEPPIIPDEFKLIGYDVADGWGLSGLMNCGIENSEHKNARLLNKNHLFSNFFNAANYAKFLNNEVKEHAPFFVYSLWELKKSMGSQSMWSM